MFRLTSLGRSQKNLIKPYWKRLVLRWIKERAILLCSGLFDSSLSGLKADECVQAHVRT
jgi:hypothetical protein